MLTKKFLVAKSKRYGKNNLIIKRSNVRGLFEGVRIGEQVFELLDERVKDFLIGEIEKAKRNALVNGRRGIKKEDFN